MTQKVLATCVAAAAIVAGVAGGMTVAETGLPAVAPAVTPAVTPAVFGTPLPADDVAGVPTTEQLNAVLYGLADPNVSFSAKSYLIEGGIGRVEARAADGMMRNAGAKGQLPLNFSIADISPVAAGAASATITATGPATPPITQRIVFVNQGGWKLSRASAGLILSMF
ncbi:MAG: hypothetical protein WBC17_09145 [Mycobacterium sp.]